MDEKLLQAYLYDFYGELLNEHQRRIFEESVFEDLSLGEIAAEEGITRQGVADMVRRCQNKLESYESRLHLVSKFLTIKSDVEAIHALTSDFKQNPDASVINQIEAISNHILEEL